MNRAGKAYVLQFGGSMLAYVVVLLISISIINQNPTAPWRFALALAPVIPAFFALLAFVRYLGRMDELQRRIQFEAFGLSFGATGILTFAYGFLENVGFPQINLIWVLPLMIALWGIGVAIASRRYA